MPNGMEGWGELGEMVAGNIGTAGTYEKALKEGYSTDKALQDARRARSLSIIDAGRADKRAGMTPELMQRMAAGDQAAQAEVMSIVLGGNSTMNMNQLGDYQQPMYGEASMRQFEGLLGDEPDVGMANRANAYIQGKAYQPTITQGGAYMADGADILGGDEYIPTLPTMTSQNRAEASIGQGQQRVDIAAAKAGRTGGGGSGGKPPTTAQSEAKVLADARAAVAGGADPAMVAARLREKGYATLAGKVYAAPKAGARE